jgi:hypothetical protein
MTRRFLAFEIETAKEIPGEDFNWRPHRPLGITCAATFAIDEAEPALWHGRTPGGSRAPRMKSYEAQELVRYLLRKPAQGYTVLTWNGLGFDFDILSEESSSVASCKQCALSHVDMMFHAFCLLGYPIAMEKAAQGMGLPGKPAGMSGVKAPGLWAQGLFKVVLDYVAQDVRVALQVAQAGERRRCLEWITRRGTRGSMPLTRGWLTVEESMRLPLPDTAWMSSPIPRRDFTAWLTEQ